MGREHMLSAHGLAEHMLDVSYLEGDLVVVHRAWIHDLASMAPGSQQHAGGGIPIHYDEENVAPGSGVLPGGHGRVGSLFAAARRGRTEQTLGYGPGRFGRR